MLYLASCTGWDGQVGYLLQVMELALVTCNWQVFTTGYPSWLTTVTVVRCILE